MKSLHKFSCLPAAVILTAVFFALAAHAAAFDPTLLQKVPSRRAAAFPIVTGDDSTSDISTKRQAYYAELKRIVGDLRKKYYFHDEFPKDLLDGLERHAIVLAGIEYPLSNVTGASAYDAILDRAKIKLADELIVAMAKAIFEEGYGNPKAKDGSPKNEAFSKWLNRWNTNNHKL